MDVTAAADPGRGAEPGEVWAAGGVVTRTGIDGTTEVLVVHRPRYGDWSWPKGKVEPGERLEDTARREVEEETGYRCSLGAEVATVGYRDRRGRRKQVRYWLMTVAGEVPWMPGDEVDERRWISAADAATLLSYDTDRRVLGSLGARVGRGAESSARADGHGTGCE